jgi:hypothetical protein
MESIGMDLEEDFRPAAGERYTLGMDSVRFGRALGFGARAAAKTLVTAVDAATSANPASQTAPASQIANQTAKQPGTETKAEPAQSRAAASGARLGQQAAQKTAQIVQTGEGLREGGKRFGKEVWGPIARLSGVLWLEVTGVFFGIFALFAAGAAWRFRGEMHGTAANPEGHAHLVWAAVMATVFGYFCISSFVSANRRSRRGRGRQQG